jgi:DNA polymerase II large subunit
MTAGKPLSNFLKGLNLMSSQTALQCKKCSKIWTRRTLLDDACPECKGEIVDITHTAKGQEFLSIISIPTEIRTSPMDNQQIYATGPSNVFSVHVGDQS